MIRFPTGWGVRINLTATLSGPRIYFAEPLLDLMPAGTPWAHWSPRVLGHTMAGWLPCASMINGTVHPAEAFANVEDGALYLIGNDMEQLAIRAGNGTVPESAARLGDQLDVLRRAAGGREWAWAGPQWNVNESNLDLLGDWLHELRQHQGYPRPHRLAVHMYGAWDAASFWEIADRFDAWREERLPDVRVIVSEFSGWPGSSLERQQAVMAAGREYLRREHVDAVMWFSGYRYLREDGQPWGTELAQVSEDGGVTLTELGRYWVALG